MNNNPHLTLNITAEGLELDAVLLNGFQIRIAGSLEALLPYLTMAFSEVKKYLPTGGN
jgi:hypothetical protein